jgi:thioredoxin
MKVIQLVEEKVKMTDNDKVTELSKTEFDGFVSDGTTLVDFYADWCMPCLMMAPVLESLSDKFGGKIKFAKINVEDNQALAQKFQVSSIPNMKLFKDGKVIENFVGAMPEEDFEERLKVFV